jgi:hypothetical protein
VTRFVAARGGLLSAAVVGTCAIGVAAGNDSIANLESALARCAAIAASGDRLACYDALAAGRGKVASPSTAASVTPPAAVPPSAAAPQPQPAPTKEDFGLSTAQKQKAQPQKQIESIQASVAGLGTSAIGRMLVNLDNGQSWELDSADPLLAVGNVVRIERGAMGSFILTTPTRRTHHARRLH